MSLFAPLALPALLLAFSGVSAQPQAVFRDTVFEITMPPGVPLPTPTRAKDANGFDYSSETQSGIYRVQYIDMPAGGPEALFSRILGSFKGVYKLEAHTRFTHQGHPAMSLTISSTQMTRMNCYAVNNRLLRAWFISNNPADLDAPAVRAFFDSLRIK
jgi:hypothetical protein